MIFRLFNAQIFKAVTLAGLACLASACVSHPPLEASWTYVPSKERAPSGVLPRPKAISVPPSQAGLRPADRAQNRLIERIQDLQADVKRLQEQLETAQATPERDPPALLFSLHNPSKEALSIHCVYLAFRDLARGAVPPERCSDTNAMTTLGGENPELDPSQYVSIGGDLDLPPGDTRSFPIEHPDCPLPTHVVLIAQRKHVPDLVGETDGSEWRKVWERKATTLLVSGETGEGYIRDVYLRRDGNDGLGCAAKP